MLTPIEIRNYKNLNLNLNKVEMISDVTFFEGVVGSRKILLNECIVEFEAPKFIRGEPFDEKCLIGVKAKKKLLPKVVLVKVDNVKIVGRTLLMYQNKTLFDVNSSTEAMYLNKNKNGHFGSLLFEDDNELKLLIRKPYDIDFLSGIGFFVSGIEPGNYGSFLLRFMCQLMLLEKSGLNITYLVVPEKKVWLMEALQYLNLNYINIYTHDDLCGCTHQQLYYFEGTENEGIFHPEIANMFLKFAEKLQEKNNLEIQYNKLYVSRRFSTCKRPNYRPLLHEKQIEKFMKSKGYTIIYPETMSFEMQVVIFNLAKIIVGPSGSGMLNSVFSKPGTLIIDMESFTHTVRQHFNIYSSTNKKNGFLFGTLKDSSKTIYSPWEIDLDLLELIILEKT